jgi:hypothetical protein
MNMLNAMLSAFIKYTARHTGIITSDSTVIVRTSEDRGVDGKIVSEWILVRLTRGGGWIHLSFNKESGGEPLGSGATELDSQGNPC